MLIDIHKFLDSSHETFRELNPYLLISKCSPKNQEIDLGDNNALWIEIS